ncbi:MAG: DUF1707 domain-containing protein [Nocardioides sp.]|nr:DUF1707 domain-containing protein [Nocardioides sp.]
MERVSDGDRNAAIRAVEAALADGRIVQADRDRRVDQLRSAQTPSELEMITHDLAYREQTWSTYTPPPEATPPPPPPPSVTYGPPQTSSPEVARLFGTKRSSKAPWMLIPVLFIFLVAGSGIFGVLRAIGDSNETFEFEFDDPAIEFPEYGGPPAAPQLFRARDFNAMRAAIRRETGSTQSFRAVVYPGYASLELPAESAGQRALSYFYDGDLGEPSKGRSTNERFDLASINPEVMARLARKAKNTLVEDPTAWYVIIEKPGPPFDNGGWFTAYASNEFGESGYLEATLDGTIVNRSVTE